MKKNCPASFEQGNLFEDEWRKRRRKRKVKKKKINKKKSEDSFLFFPRV